MKITHLQKKLWIPFLHKCHENLNHPSVLAFCSHVYRNLSRMHDDDGYTALYCGETVQTFDCRKQDKDP